MSVHRPRQRRMVRRSGFTLMELMLVMAILVVLATMSTVAVMKFQGSSNKKAARVEIETFTRAAKFYRIDMGQFPNALNDLVIKPSGASSAWEGPYLDRETIPMDPWGREYKYSIDNQRDRVVVVSAGKDGQVGSADDIPDPTVRQ